ncbi:MULTISPECIES: alanine/glycine:cation symporter family protein [unclassified Flavonifractor]|uniref:alanine/glycine:cation symporter family protein n=3 Tax=Flavonifractor TaxID=946234 RepID=UPI000B370566|nr:MULTISPECIES: sodium:alanine symporter family protein [unclassified Flavonifractor]HIZ94143.1 sodium:alanine symporter family protein [Candidatus Flavonifractor avicola]OUN14592.1 sodium:alanine symporter family protein [Flavonifractor sp. An91]OUN84022.1 sodium:alanine symporter family protein [Flavonifractor sp. An52]OUO17298.1 sodium:alanine symporter family protein [Flavonifractor sp. An4]OUQ58984.1 sodium:alanine symporter family protein [Flavonifractor sp. An112]
MDVIVSFINWLDDFIWGIPMIVLLFGTHLFMTARTGFIQRKTFTGIRLSVTRDPDSPGDVSQFQALTTALASTIGTGNIIGVGTAIFLGGPGAVFWCWIAGIFGIATKYAESLIAVKYRVRTPDGKMQGGAMYALERGLGLKWLGVLFAALAALASFGIGCGTQINAIAEVIENNIPLPIPPIVVGIVGGLLTAIVIIGGINSIASVCEKLVPFMAAFYVLGCIIILGFNYDFILPAIGAIVRLAFTPGAVAGGLVGQGLMIAMRFGVARGLFSNESGMGSAPLVASAAQTRNPVRQALVSATGTFWDTVVVCLMTGLVLVSTIMKNPAINMADITDGGKLTTLAFSQIPVLGPVILVVGIITFAWSTILGWSYYGERCAQYLWGKKAILPYKILFVAVVVVGPVLALDLVWTIADILNALMAIPNLIAVLLLSGVIAKETKYYLSHLDEVDTTEIPSVDK